MSDLHGLQPARLLCPWDFPGKNAGVGCHFLIQGIFLTWGSNLHLLHLLPCRQILYPLSHLGSLIIFMVKVKLVLIDSAFGARVQACFWKLNPQYSLACVLGTAISFLKLYYWGKKKERRQWHPTPVCLPGKSHGQRSLVGCCPWGR